jgi:hypothetical protein
VIDHATEMVGRLAQQFRRPKIEAYLRVVAAEVQALEVALIDLYTLRAIDTATGEELTRIGERVGQPRAGMSNDFTYRRIVRARIASNRSRGTANDIIRVARAALPEVADYKIRAKPLGIAGYELHITSPTIGVFVDFIAPIAALIRRATPAGIRAIVETATSSDDYVFEMAQSAYVKGAHVAGGVTLDVYTPAGVNGAFPFPQATGKIRIDEGLATQEDRAYSVVYAITGGYRFKLEAPFLTQNHADYAAVRWADVGIGYGLGLGYPYALFMDGAQGGGSGTVTVLSGGLAYPASGKLRLDPTLGSQEDVTYTSRTDTVFTLVGTTAQAHSDLSAVESTSSTSLAGGALATAVG